MISISYVFLTSIFLLLIEEIWMKQEVYVHQK